MSDLPVALLLAAGYSRRFGADKRLAQLANGTHVAVQSAWLLQAAGLAVQAVIRPEDERLQLLFQQQGVHCIDCMEAALGMAASLRAGVEATPQAAAWLVALADMPFIQPATVQRLIAVWRQQGGIVLPSWQGKRGHPVIFTAPYREALLALQGDQGARPVLQQHAAAVQTVPLEDAGIHQDIDTPQALALWQ